MTQHGWVCPLCGKVNAPWVASCDCVKQAAPMPYIGDPIPGTAPYIGDPIPPYYVTTTTTWASSLDRGVADLTAKKMQPL